MKCQWIVNRLLLLGELIENTQSGMAIDKIEDIGNILKIDEEYLKRSANTVAAWDGYLNPENYIDEIAMRLQHEK